MTDQEQPYIRLMIADDAELFVEFYAALSEESLYFFTPHDPHPQKLRELIRGIPLERNTRRFAAIAKRGGAVEIAGYMFLWDLNTGIPWLGICVRDDYKGKGIGTALMRHAEDYCKKLGKGGILLTTHKENFKAQGLYKKVQYEVIGTDHRGEILLLRRFEDEQWIERQVE